MKSFVRIESVWEDDSLLEVRILASNGEFSGGADCYTNREAIAELGNSLCGFPGAPDSVVDFTTGESENSSYFTLEFYCVDGLGHVMSRVKIYRYEEYVNKKSDYDLAVFGVSVEPSQIDSFARQLNRVATEEIGSVDAEIRGCKS